MSRDFMRRLSLLAVLVALPLAAQRIDGLPHAAAVAELAPATLGELARAAVMPAGGEHDEKTRPAPAPRRTHANAIAAELVPAPEADISAPPARGFRASFDSPALSPAAGYVTPPDASGAVGPRHVVGAFNNSLMVQDRSGAQLALVTMPQFWHDPAFPDTTLYDPRVLYDAANDRWALTMLTDTNGRAGVLLFAVSASGDPSGAWRRFRVSGSTNPDVQIDFTRMAMTADQIAITANEYIGDAPSGADVFTIAKSAAYGSGTVTVAKTYAPALFDLTPVASADATLRILTQDYLDVVYYELAAGRLAAETTYSAPMIWGAGPWGCPELGKSNLIQCGDSTLQYALFRDGTLWVVQSANNYGRGEIVIWKISAAGAKAFEIHELHRDYGYPSLAVNRYGEALIGFSSCDASIYPSAAYRYIDSRGNVSAPAAAKDGEEYYTFYRYGDYSTTVVDPLDDTSFWTLQSYAGPSQLMHSWSTWWSYVQVQPPQRVRAIRH